MSLRSIARGAAVASSVVMLSGYVWYRSDAGANHAEAPPPPRAAQRAAAADAGKANPTGYAAESSDPNISLMEVFPGSKSAPMDFGPQPKAGYVFSVMTGQGDAAPGGSKQYIVAGNAEPLSPAAPPEKKRTTMLSGSKSERVVFLEPSSPGEGAPATPPEPKRRVLMPGSKSADLLPDSAMPGAMVQSREAPESPAVQQAPPAPAKKKRRVLMSSSKSKPVEWVDVDDEKTDAPQQQQEQRRAEEDGK